MQKKYSLVFFLAAPASVIVAEFCGLVGAVANTILVLIERQI